MWRSVLSRCNTPVAAMLIVAVAYALFIGARLTTRGRDPSRFVRAGDYFCDPARAPRNLTIDEGSTGYDGQFYYRLALNPFTSRKTEFGVSLDKPSYRHQRILYPLLVWVLSAGQPLAVPAVMIAVNFLALCALGWLGGFYAAKSGHHPVWGAVFAFYPGFLITLSYDLAEIVAAACLLSAFVLLERGRGAGAAVALALAVLARETTVVAAGAMFLAWGIHRLWRRRPDGEHSPLPLYVPLAAFAAFGVWRIILRGIWGEFPAPSQNADNFGVPVLSFIDAFRNSTQLAMAEMMLMLLFAGAVAYALPRSRAPLYQKLAWLFYGGLALLLSSNIWGRDAPMLRANTEFVLLGFALLMQTATILWRYIVMNTAIAWTYLALHILRNR
uniref:Glycosyltransferase RgtA/B/C/D-like domain-containing protein n=1 Tax=uncultured Armatimonadetes bacterium TaxID=157466 RepID=A0A6J4IHW9_9BACT|nr:hypothetical protein AVDCRST_MAG63-1898 [uncultured Armatimonadetes bacterium]